MYTKGSVVGGDILSGKKKQIFVSGGGGGTVGVANSVAFELLFETYHNDVPHKRKHGGSNPI